MRINIGLWHDLELHAFAPYFVRDAQAWDYAAGTTAATSTLTTNTIDVSGCGGTRCGTVTPIVAVPGSSMRRGFGDPTIGLAWGPVNEERELRLQPQLFPEGKPVSTWVIGVDYTLPVGGAVDAPGPTASTESKKAHVVTVWTAFSKRYKVLEPYMKVSGTAAFAASNAYDNCGNEAILSEVAAVNCRGTWKGQTGYKPPYQADFTVGAELVAAEDRKDNQRLAFDIRADLRYHGPGRDYTQVSDGLGKLTYADEYLTSLGSFGIYGRLARWFHLRVYGSVGFETAHFLTHEAIGEDKDGKGITISGGRGVPAPNQNPNYDFRLDQVGRRLRAEPAMIWGVAGSLALNF
jgi:hypothetical protein